VRDLGSAKRLKLPVHEHVRFVLVRPHYPENFGASARALKAMGFGELVLVQPGRLCTADHEMAFKMAVKSWDVLENARVVRTLEDAIEGASAVVATTARRGVSGVKSPREIAAQTVSEAVAGRRSVFLFGNEKTGLSDAEHGPATAYLRIPMAADQPSINLAQAVQLVAYELFATALYARGSEEG
jgi:TrmH family RNA methyltransferase